jgi:hypothetical protein
VVAGSPGKPVVLERRRIETADTAIPDSKQPYYAAEWLGVEKWIRPGQRSGNATYQDLMRILDHPTAKRG